MTPNPSNEQAGTPKCTCGMAACDPTRHDPKCPSYQAPDDYFMILDRTIDGDASLVEVTYERDKLKAELQQLTAELAESDKFRQQYADKANELEQAIVAAIKEREVVEAELAKVKGWHEQAEKDQAESDKQLCQLQDALGCPCEMDNAQEKAMERLRDLIAAEGELGDTRAELAKVREERDKTLAACDGEINRMTAKLRNAEEVLGGCVSGVGVGAKSYINGIRFVMQYLTIK
jgi:DNA repair exonuclease SbcCD ATPase subunit